MKKILNVFISGLGLIGSSLARIIKKQDEKSIISAFDPDQNNIEFMLNNNLIDREATFDNGAKDADIIILAGPVNAIIKQIKALCNLQLKSNVLVTDVGSTKSSIMKASQNLIDNNINFIGGHPMAGSQLSGSQAGSIESMSNATYFLIGNPSKAELLIELLKPANLNFIFLSSQEHDRIVSNISHLPHALAFSLVSTTNKELGERLGSFKPGGGFLSTTRIAAADPTMWTDIFLNNKEKVINQIDNFERELGQLKKYIKSNDKDDIKNYIQKAQLIRQKMK